MEIIDEDEEMYLCHEMSAVSLWSGKGVTISTCRVLDNSVGSKRHGHIMVGANIRKQWGGIYVQQSWKGGQFACPIASNSFRLKTYISFGR